MTDDEEKEVERMEVSLAKVMHTASSPDVAMAALITVAADALRAHAQIPSLFVLALVTALTEGTVLGADGRIQAGHWSGDNAPQREAAFRAFVLSTSIRTLLGAIVVDAMEAAPEDAAATAASVKVRTLAVAVALTTMDFHLSLETMMGAIDHAYGECLQSNARHLEECESCRKESVARAWRGKKGEA